MKFQVLTRSLFPSRPRTKVQKDFLSLFFQSCYFCMFKCFFFHHLGLMLVFHISSLSFSRTLRQKVQMRVPTRTLLLCVFPLQQHHFVLFCNCCYYHQLAWSFTLKVCLCLSEKSDECEIETGAKDQKTQRRNLVFLNCSTTFNQIFKGFE